jgi:hypothetical protein
MSELRFCFVSYEDNEQAEPGDTYTHTWLKPAWGYCITKSVLFWGLVGGVVSPSTSPFFTYHNNYPWSAPIEEHYHILTSAHDCMRCWASGTWHFYLNSTMDLFGYQTPTNNRFGSGMIFSNVTIPPGSEIIAAELNFWSATNSLGACEKVKVRVELTANALQFSTEGNLWSRNWSSPPLYWLNIPPWLANTWHTSLDVSSLVQQVISLSGWQAGNRMAFLFDDWDNNCTHDRRPLSFDGSAFYSPFLWVKFKTPL